MERGTGVLEVGIVVDIVVEIDHLRLVVLLVMRGRRLVQEGLSGLAMDETHDRSSWVVREMREMRKMKQGPFRKGEPWVSKAPLLPHREASFASNPAKRGRFPNQHRTLEWGQHVGQACDTIA